MCEIKNLLVLAYHKVAENGDVKVLDFVNELTESLMNKHYLLGKQDRITPNYSETTERI